MSNCLVQQYVNMISRFEQGNTEPNVDANCIRSIRQLLTIQTKCVVFFELPVPSMKYLLYLYPIISRIGKQSIVITAFINCQGRGVGGLSQTTALLFQKNRGWVALKELWITYQRSHFKRKHSLLLRLLRKIREWRGESVCLIHRG